MGSKSSLNCTRLALKPFLFAMDHEPLLDKPAKSSPTKVIVILILAVALVGAIIGIAVLGVKLRDAKRPIIYTPSPAEPTPSTVRYLWRSYRPKDIETQKRLIKFPCPT